MGVFFGSIVVLSCGAICISRRPSSGGLLIICIVSALLSLMGVSLPMALAWLFSLVCLLCIHFSKIRWIAFAGVFGWFIGFGCYYAKQHERIDRMKEEYAFKSLSERLPKMTRQTSIPSEETLDEILDETLLNENSQFDYYSPQFGRVRSIASIHSSAVKNFLDGPENEFGVSRMRRSSVWDLHQMDRLEVATLAPTLSDRHVNSIDTDVYFVTQSNFPIAPKQEELNKSHRYYANWFLDRERFGVVRNRDQVAGFQPHAMIDRRYDHAPLLASDTQWNGNEPFWSVTKLQLVGLLFEVNPVVYNLDTLPELLTAATAPKRALNEFEVRGLAQLEAGRSIYAEQEGPVLRMVGAMRNKGTCIQCHSEPEASLLGAFSYELVGPGSKGPKGGISLNAHEYDGWKIED